MALTGRAVALALLGVLLVLAVPGPGPLLLLNLGLVALILLDVALAGGVRALRLRRGGATRTRQGEPVVVTLEVRNNGRRTARLRLRDAWPPSAGSSPRVHVVVVPAGENRVLDTQLRPSRRGDRRPARVTVRSIGPLGLAARQGRHQAPWTVRVLPPFGSRRLLPEKLNRLRIIEGRVAARGPGRGSEFDSLREYVPGDDVRAIDWRATARRDAVVVRTFRPERDRRVILVIDTGRTSAGRVGDTPRLDHYLDAALLLAALAERAGDRVSLIAYDAVLRAAVAGGRGSALPAFVETMARLDPALLEVDYGAVVSQVLKQARRRALVVLLSDLNAAVVEESLLPALAPLVRRHTVLLAAVEDPRVADLAGGRGHPDAIYAAASAARSRTERRLLAELLRRVGLEVIDAPPARFPPAVADAYLELKAAGRL